MEKLLNKFQEGDIVFAKVNPSNKLKVRRYIDEIYYCTIVSNPSLKELVYFERELSWDGDGKTTVQ